MEQQGRQQGIGAARGDLWGRGGGGSKRSKLGSRLPTVLTPSLVFNDPPLLLRVLLEHGADVHVKTSKEGFTPLHIACSVNHRTCTENVSFNAVAMLLEYGAKLDAQV
jgi:hypothetical protein